MQLDEFTKGYINASLEIINGECYSHIHNEDGTTKFPIEFKDVYLDMGNIDQEEFEKIIQDCQKFQEQSNQIVPLGDNALSGYIFSYIRNDYNLDYSSYFNLALQPIAQQFDDLANQFPKINLYVENNHLYGF